MDLDEPLHTLVIFSIELMRIDKEISMCILQYCVFKAFLDPRMNTKYCLGKKIFEGRGTSFLKMINTEGSTRHLMSMYG